MERKISEKEIDEMLDPKELEGINNLAEEIFKRPKAQIKEKGKRGRKKKAAVINADFDNAVNEMIEENNKIAPAQMDVRIPEEVVKVCETRIEWLSSQIEEMQAQTNEIESLIRKFKEECKVLVDFIVQKGQ